MIGAHESSLPIVTPDSDRIAHPLVVEIRNHDIEIPIGIQVHRSDFCAPRMIKSVTTIRHTIASRCRDVGAPLVKLHHTERIRPSNAWRDLFTRVRNQDFPYPVAIQVDGWPPHD
jgi:hypothetical protein